MSSSTTLPAAVAATTTTETYIEHIVLFKVKPDADPESINGMSNKMKSLNSIDHVLHLTAGPIHRIRSSSPDFTFTHMLHSRYSSKEELLSYRDHPTHVAVVKQNQPLVEDNLAVDWIVDEDGFTAILPVGSTLKVGLIKLKEGVEEKIKIEILSLIKSRFDGVGVNQFSCGENFSMGKAKGFTVAALVVVDGIVCEEEEGGLFEFEFDSSEFKEYVDSVIVIDYIVPQL